MDLLNLIILLVYFAGAVAEVRVSAPGKPSENLAIILPDENHHQNQVRVSKCCEVNSILVESEFGFRECRRRADILHISMDASRRKWAPTFYDYETGTEIHPPEQYVLDPGLPECDPTEIMFAIFHHEIRTDDEMMLLANGTLTHKLVHEHENVISDTRLYEPGKYCVENLIIAHNHTFGEPAASASPVDNLREIDFAFICVRNQVDMQAVLENYIYPIGIAASLLSLILTFLLYCFLPQLRDLTGKFILAICCFTTAALALTLVDLYSWRDSNIQKLTSELLLHASVAGIWFSLNSMGHHVWKIIRQKSVFTRVTDGRRLLYYSVYILSGTAGVTGIAAMVHFFVEKEERPAGKFKLGWSCLAAFYLPMSLLLLVSVYFYWTSQRRITRHLIYNRSMQHFQVNFELYTKFLIVIGIWWLFHTLSLLQLHALVCVAMVFHIVQGPLLFCVSMCRTRVAYLFKKYFCKDSCCLSCCRTNEFIEMECEELATIDALRDKADRADGALPTSTLLTNGRAGADHHELSKSLFNVRHREPGEVVPPPEGDVPVGRIKRLLKSNSLNALANINFGWRKETSV